MKKKNITLSKKKLLIAGLLCSIVVSIIISLFTSEIYDFVCQKDPHAISGMTYWFIPIIFICLITCVSAVIVAAKDMKK